MEQIPSMPEPANGGINRRRLLIGGGAAAAGVLVAGAVIAVLESSSGSGTTHGGTAPATPRLAGAPQLLTPMPTGNVTATDISGAQSADAVAVSPDGKLVAVGYVRNEASTSTAGFVQVWSLPDRARVAAAEIPGFGASTVAFSPDGKTLAINAVSKVLLWNLDSGTAPVAVPGTLEVYESSSALSFAPNGKTLGSANRAVPDCSAGVQLWSLSGTSADAPESLSVGCDYSVPEVTNFAYSPDGSMAAAGVMSLDATNFQLTTWDLPTGKQTNRAVAGEGDSTTLSLAFSPDGRRVVTTCTEVELWDAQGSGGPVATWAPTGKGAPTSFIDVQYSHSGEYVLACGIDGVLYLLNATTAKLVAKLPSGSFAVNSFRFLAADKGIACAGMDADQKPKAWVWMFA